MREALKLALECAERCESIDGMYSWADTINAIKEALAQPEPPPECQTEAEKTAFAFGWFKAMEAQRLAQPEQEPVAYIDMSEWPPVRFKEGTLRCDIAHLDGQKLYTTPPQRKPLTDEQKQDLIGNYFAEDWAQKAAKGLLHDYEIKAAHGIKE